MSRPAGGRSGQAMQVTQDQCGPSPLFLIEPKKDALCLLPDFNIRSFEMAPVPRCSSWELNLNPHLGGSQAEAKLVYKVISRTAGGT